MRNLPPPMLLAQARCSPTAWGAAFRGKGDELCITAEKGGKDSPSVFRIKGGPQQVKQAEGWLPDGDLGRVKWKKNQLFTKFILETFPPFLVMFCFLLRKGSPRALFRIFTFCPSDQAETWETWETWCYQLWFGSLRSKISSPNFLCLGGAFGITQYKTKT